MPKDEYMKKRIFEVSILSIMFLVMLAKFTGSGIETASASESGSPAIYIYANNNGEPGDLLRTITWDETELITKITDMLNECFSQTEEVKQAKYILEFLNKKPNGTIRNLNYLQIWYDDNNVICYSENFESTPIGPGKETIIGRSELENIINNQ